MSIENGSNELSSQHPLSTTGTITSQNIKSAKLTENKIPLEPSKNESKTPAQTTSESPTQPITDSLTNPIITQTADTLKNVNIIKDELCKLPLNPCELEYITNSVLPLLTIINDLSNAVYNYAGAITSLNISPLVHPDRSELKDGIHLCYKILDQSQDVYDVLKKRINLLLKNT